MNAASKTLTLFCGWNWHHGSLSEISVFLWSDTLGLVAPKMGKTHQMQIALISPSYTTKQCNVVK